MVEYETILKLDKQLKAIEDQIQEMRRQLLPVKSPKKLQMIAARGPNQQFFWDMRVHWGHSVLGAPTCEFVRAALEHGNAPVRDMKNVRVPSEIFEGKCEFWMKTVLDSPILLLYLPTEERYSGFDEEVAWRHPSVRKSPYYWRRKFESHLPVRGKPDDLLNDFVEVAKQNLSLRTDIDVLVAAIKAGNKWNTDCDFYPAVDPSVTLPAHFWVKALKETNGFALKHMSFEQQVQHAEIVKGSVQFFDKTSTLSPLVAPKLWSNRSFCIEWLRRMAGDRYDSNSLYSLIPSGVWSDRSFCLEVVQMRHRFQSNTPLISPCTLRPLIAPALWSDKSFCMEWVQLMNDTAGELRPIIPANVWSEESFCVMRAKHMKGEKLCGTAEIFREAVKATPALRENAELMLAALRWAEGDRTLTWGVVAPSLYDQPEFFQKALEVTDSKVLEVISHDRQHHFREMILAYFSKYRMMSKSVWPYLAPAFHEDCSFCVEWIRGVGDDERTFNNIPQSMINSKEFWLELAPYGKEWCVKEYVENSCPFLVVEDFLLQMVHICPDLLACSSLWKRIFENKELAILAMAQTNLRINEGLFWRLHEHLQEDFDVQVCALAHKESTTVSDSRWSTERERDVAQMYKSCKLEMRDRLRTHYSYMHCLELEPTMNVPGLKEEFSGYLGVSSGKDLSRLMAAWRQ